MKQKTFTLTFLFAMLFSVGTKAQEILIQGSNLNIGQDNYLIEIENGYYGNAIGRNHYIQAASTLAVGYKDTITSYAANSVAFGSVNKVVGNSSMAVGSNVRVLQGYSMGIGRHLNVTGGYSVIIGNGITNPGMGPDVMLENPYHHSLMIGFLSSKPTFTVGPSPNTFGSVIDRTGKVAIGDVPVPDIAAKLHIRSDEDEDAGVFLEPKDLENSSAYIKMRDEDHGIIVDKSGNMTIKSKNGYANSKLLLQGKVGINIANLNSMNSSYSLYVKDGIMTDRINIKNVNHWPDYVFSSDYLLMPLSDLKAFVTENHHLPEVPSENDIMAEGVEIGDMQGILLKKIEEMTLYILQQQEQIDKLERRINELEGN